MTNSTDNTKKVLKKKGPIRFEAIIPVALVLTAIGLYFFLLFDFHLKKTIEWGGTFVNQAEVNVGSLKTSFWKASMTIKNIEVTQRSKPERNLVKIGRVHFQALWDALLRAKLVIPDVSITGIEIYSPRKKPGFILDPKKSATHRLLSQAAKSSLDRAGSEFEGNALGEAAGLMKGVKVDDRLEELAKTSQADKYTKELEQNLKSKESEWQKRLKEIPTPKEFKDLEQRVKNVKIDTGSPASIKKSIDEINAITKEAEQKIKTVNETASSANSDMKSFSDSINQLDDIIKKDIADLESRLKIPKLDPESLTKVLFGSTSLSKVKQAQTYIAMGRKYMPPKKAKSAKDEKDELIAPPARGVGKTYAFGRQNSYPQVWLQLARIESTGEHAAAGGDVEGEIRNFTSHPQVLGKPAIIEIKGDFPKHSVRDIKVNVKIDHTGEIPTETFKATVGSYPVESKVLSNSEEVKMGFNKAKGSIDIDGEMKAGDFSMLLHSKFSSIDYYVTGKSQKMEEALKRILGGIPIVTAEAKAFGKLPKLNWKLKSNLGDEIIQGIKAEVDHQIKMVKAKIKNQIEGQIKERREKIESQVNAFKEKYQGQINQAKAKADETKKLAQNKIDEAKKKQSGKVKKEGKKLLDGIKKKFKF